MAVDKNQSNNPPIKGAIPVPQISELGLRLAGFNMEPTKVGADYTESQYTPNVFPQELGTLEDRRALLQPWTDKLGNGLVNATSNAFTAATNNTVGLVAGAFESLVTGDPSRMWNNEVTQAMNDLSESIRENNPFYYSEAEKNASLLASMGKANFWWDKVLGGTGYIAGSYLTGLGAARLFQMGKAAQLAKLEAGATELGATAEGLTAAATEMGRTNLVKDFAVGLAMANGESVVESLETAQQTEDFLIEARKKGQQGDPQFAEYANITDDQIQKYKVDAGNTNWLANIFLTGGGNMLLLKNWINPGKKAAIKEYNEIGKTTLQNGAVEYFDRVAAKKQGAFLTVGKAAAKGFGEEAIQEGSQFASNIAAQEYVKRYNVEGQTWFTSVMEGLAEGIEETLTTKEGLESMLVGGISGAPFGTKGAVSDKLAREKNTKDLLESIKLDPRFSKAAPKVQAYLSSMKGTKEAEEYLKQGDLFNAKNKSDMALNDYIKSQIDVGAVDYFLARLESLKNGPAQDLQEFFGQGTTLQDVDKIINKTKNLIELNNSINTLYSTAGGTPEQKQYNAMLRDKLFYSAATIKDYEQREKAINQELQDMQSPALSNLMALRAQALNIDKTVIPDNILEKEVDKYLENLKKTTTDTYNKALDAYVAQDPVNGTKATELLADLNNIDKYKKDFIRYYNALNDPAYAQQLMDAENFLQEKFAQEAEEEAAKQKFEETLAKEANLSEDLINDVFKKDVNAVNKALDLNGNEVDLAQLSDAELRGLRDEMEQSAAVLGDTDNIVSLRNAIEKELDARDQVVTAESLKQELASARTPEQVDRIVAKATENNFIVNTDKVRAIHEELLERQRKKQAEDVETKDAVSNFKDIREFTNSLVAPIPDVQTREEAQKNLDDILTQYSEVLDEITLKVTKNPNPVSTTRLKGVEYSVSGSPLIMAIMYKGKEIAYIPYFQKFVNEKGEPLDPILMTYEQWVELFKPDKRKQTPENFILYKDAYVASRQLFIYLNENLAKGKSEYTNQEVKDILNPKVNLGTFDIVGASPETALSEGHHQLYRDEADNILIVDTRAANSENYTSVGNTHIDPETLTIADRYKAAFDALAERKAAGKITRNIIKQRYVALVATPLGTITIPGDPLKYEWVPITPAQASVSNLLDTLKQYQKDKVDSEQIARELNSNIFFALTSDWDIGLFMNPELTDFILKFEYKGETPVYVRVPITEGLTEKQFLEAINKYIIDKKESLKVAGIELHKHINAVTSEGITEQNFRVQIPNNLPDLTTEQAIDSFYSILSENIKRNTSFNFKFNAPAVASTQPVPVATPAAVGTTALPTDTLKAGLETLKNKILNSANPKIKLNDSLEALKKYGFTELQIKRLKQVLGLDITAVEAVQALIDKANGKVWDFPLDDDIISQTLESFVVNGQITLSVTQAAPVQPAPTQVSAAPVSDKKAIVAAGIREQGTQVSVEVIGDSGKEFLLVIDRNSKGRVELFSEKKDWGDGTFTYRPGEQASQEQIAKLYNKYVPESVRNLITEWQNSFTGSWAAPETEDGKRHRAIEEKLNKELAALEGAPAQPTAAPVTSTKPVNPRGANAKNFNPKKDDSDSSGERLTVRRDLTAAFAYLKSIFGNSVDAREFEGLEENLANGKVRYGNFKNALIRLSRFSPIGTEYHEAFHAVFRMFLTDKEITYYRALGKDSLYQELKKQGKSINQAFAEFKKDFLLKNPDVKTTDLDLMNLMIEEHLADRFKNWKLKKESAKSGLAKLLSNLWEKFTRLINTMVEGDQADEVDALFEQIDSGKFKDAAQVANQYTNNVLPADVSLYAGTRSEIDEASGEERVYPVYLPEHVTNQLIGTVINKVYNMRKENPAMSYDTLIERAMNELHKQFELDSRFDVLLESTNQKAKDLLYSLEYALDKNSWANKAEDETGKTVTPAYSPRKTISDTVKSALKSFNFDIDKVLQENETTEEKVAAGDTSNNEESSEKNRELNQENLGGWNNLSKKLRAYISLTTYNTNLNDFFGVDGVFADDQNITLAVDIKRVYNGIAKVTQNSLTPKEIMTKLIHYRNVAGEAKSVIDKLLTDLDFPVEAFLSSGEYSEKDLNQDNIDIYYAFVKGFNLHAFDHSFTEHDFETGLARTYSSNRKASDQVQFSAWRNDFTKQHAKWGATKEARIAYVKSNITPLLVKAKNAISVDYTNNKKEPIPMSEKVISSRMDMVRKAFDAVGIKVSDGYLKFIVLNNSAYTAITSEQKSYIESFEYNMKENATYLIDTVNEFIEHIERDDNPFKREKKVKAPKAEVVEGAPQAKEKEIEAGLVTRLLTMAKNNELFDETVAPNSYLNAENKTIYSLQKPTADSIITLAIARDRQDLLPLNYQSKFFEGHYLLNSDDFKKIRQYIKIIREDGGRVRNLKWNEATKKYEVDTNTQTEKGVTFGSYKARELAIAEYSHYLDSRYDTLVGRGQVKVRPVLLDIMENSSSLDLVPLPIIQTIDKEGNITDSFKQAILKEVKREWDRIQQVKLEDNDPATKKEGFNYGATDEKRPELRGYKFWQWSNLLSFNSSTLKTDLEASDNFDEYSEDILKQIDGYFNDQITQHLDQLATLGVVRKGKEGEKTYYVNVLLDTRYGRRNVRNKKGEWVSEKADERKTKLANMQKVQMGNPFTSEYAGDNIAQVFLSNYLNRLSYNQLVKGDAAEVVKNPIDWFKRAKGRNASGDSLYSEDMPETRFAIIGQRDPLSNKIADPSRTFSVTNRLLDMNNPEDAQEFADVLQAIQDDTTLSEKEKEKKLADLKKKGKVDIADAQGWVDARTYMNYLHGLGKLSKQTREIYNKIIKGEKVKPEELKVLKDQGVMGNSLKVVYYDGVRFFKLSVQLLSRAETSTKVNGEWVAIPGMEIKHNMLDQMEEHNINLLIPPSASKMLTENVIEMNSDDTFKVTDAKRQVGKISNLFGRLQQENPSNKTKITLPTQMETIIEAEQDLSQKIDYPFFPGVKTVGDLLKHFQDAKAKKIARSYVPVKNVVFALQNGKIVPNMGRLAKIMRDNLVRTGATGQLLDFFQVDENGIPTYDFANMPHTQAKFEALYNSHFNTVFKQVVPGYKTTLQSAFGHKLMYYLNEKGEEVIVNKAMFDENPEKYLADYKAGRLKTRELAYNKPRYDKNGKQIGTYAEFVMSAHFAAQYGLKPGDIIPEEIAYMFGVRIPSQDKHSAVALKLVDILPGFTGSNAVFPHEFVKLMGHDFDIDSLYIHRPAHYVKFVNGEPKFMVYGNTEDDAFEQYVTHYQNDKFVSLLIKEYLDEKLSKHTTRGSQKEELETLLRDMNEEYALDKEDTVVKDELWLKIQKKEIQGLEKELNNLDKELTLRAMKELGLPSTKAEFEAQTRKEGELNPSVLDNQTLNAKIALHTNPAIRKVTSTPATIDEVENILNTIAKAQGLSSYEEMDKLYDVSSLSALMQALESNRAGQESIGAAVNATQIFVRLKEFGVKLGEKMLEKVPTINGYASSGYLGYVTQEEQRVMDILSTLTSAMTDNPKYGFVKKLGLTIDVLSNVANLVSLGYNLKDAMFLVNQDYVKEYTTFVANKQNPLRPLGEKFVNPQKFFNSKLEEIENELKEHSIFLGISVPFEQLDSTDFTSAELLEGLTKKERTDAERVAYLITNYKALKAYENIEPITRTYAKIGNVIKISKGTGSTFEDEDFIVQTFEELGGKFYKDSNGNWQIGQGKENIVMPNVLSIFTGHAAIKANLLALADKRSNTGKIAITQTPFFRKAMLGVFNNLKERLVDTASKKNTAKKAFLAFLTLRAYRLQQEGTGRAVKNLPELIYKLEDQQITLADEYKILAEKYPELVGRSTALFSLGFNPETSNGFTGITYNNMKGNTEFENRLTNDLENLYNHKETRPFITKLFNYLIAKDALQFKNESFINIMPAELFKRFSVASEAVKTILNKEATDAEYTKLFGQTQDKVVDEFMEMYVRDYANSRDLMFVADAISEENFPVTKNEDDSITFDLFKGWGTMNKDDIMAAIQASIDENGEGLSNEEIRSALKNSMKQENIEIFLKNKEQLNELFILTKQIVDGKRITKVAFKDGFNVKGGTYVLVTAESSQVTKEGVMYTPGERSNLTGLKGGTRATYVLKPSLGDKFNKVVPYGMTMQEVESITQNKLKKQVTEDVNGEPSDTPNTSYVDSRIAANKAAKAQAPVSTVNFQEDQNTGYTARTRKNASADATIAIAVDFNSAGEKLTKSSVQDQKKKYIPVNVTTSLKVDPAGVQVIVRDLNAIVVNPLETNKGISLNIAGNGIYTMKGKYTQEQVDEFTYQLLKAVVESPNLKNKITSIRTGGQTGFDEAGAKAGIKLGIPTSILAPKGWKFRNISGQDISNEQAFKARFSTTQAPVSAQPSKSVPTSNVEVVERYTDADVKANPDKIYVFGDNAFKRGTAGQAQIRNNPNAMGIMTKAAPSMEESAFLSDADLAAYKVIIDGQIAKIKATGKPVVFPKDGLGTGLAKLKEKAPQSYAYLKEKLLQEFGFNNDTGEVTNVKPTSTAVTNITAAKSEDAESSLNLIDPNALPPRAVMEKNLASARIAEGADIMSTPFAVKALSDEELTKEWILKCFGK